MGRPTSSDIKSLKFPHGLQRALTHFGLVGRVGGEELAACDELKDRGRGVISVQASPEERRSTAHVRVGTEQTTGIPIVSFGLRTRQWKGSFETHISGISANKSSMESSPISLQHFGLTASIGQLVSHGEYTLCRLCKSMRVPLIMVLCTTCGRTTYHQPLLGKA